MARLKMENQTSELDDIPLEDMLRPDMDLMLENVIELSSQDILLASLHDNSDTMDVKEKYCAIPVQKLDIFIPDSPVGPPDRQVFPGALNFSIEVNSADTHKKKFMYSHRLNRIYVDIKCNFSVQFKWDHDKVPCQMFVRATTVFSDETQAEKRVERCLQHLHDKKSNSGVSEELAGHVLRSARSAAAAGVHYCGSAARPDRWYSVLVHFPQPASHAYYFVCKNSCASGINRRAIDIIFTLEDQTGAVFGREIVGARVCSCLKRDLNRDEEAEGAFRPGKKRTAANAIDADRSKRPREVIRGTDVITLPSMQVIGSAAVRSGLNVMVDMMQLECSYKNEAEKEVYKKCIADLESFIKKLGEAEPQLK